MKRFLLISSIFISSIITAQTKVTVTVANFSFTPSTLMINVGDTVEFVNISGIHWVDGTQATFPSNPVSFDNLSQSGSGWTYNQVFNTVGVYAYRCGIHTLSMFGGITVQAPVGVNEQVGESQLHLYPNPTSKDLFFSGYKGINNVTIYSLTGEIVLESKSVKDKLDVSTLSSGSYFVKVISDEGETTKKLIIQ